MLHRIHLLESLWIKTAKLLGSLSLLLKCRDQSTIFCFLRSNVISRQWLLGESTNTLLHEWIHFVQWKLHEISHIGDSHTASCRAIWHWLGHDCITFKISSCISSHNKTRLCNNFQCLYKAQNPPPTFVNSKTVVNTSDIPLHDPLGLLKGLNFALFLSVAGWGYSRLCTEGHLYVAGWSCRGCLRGNCKNSHTVQETEKIPKQKESYHITTWHRNPEDHNLNAIWHDSEPLSSTSHLHNIVP